MQEADFFTVQEARVTNSIELHISRGQLQGCDAEVFWTGDKDKPMSTGGILLIVWKSLIGQLEYHKELRSVAPRENSIGGVIAVQRTCHRP